MMEVDIDNADAVNTILEVAIHGADKHVVEPAKAHGFSVCTVMTWGPDIDKCLGRLSGLFWRRFRSLSGQRDHWSENQI